MAGGQRAVSTEEGGDLPIGVGLPAFARISVESFFIAGSVVRVRLLTSLRRSQSPLLGFARLCSPFYGGAGQTAFEKPIKIPIH
jgi:hypothetical protein